MFRSSLLHLTWVLTMWSLILTSTEKSLTLNAEYQVHSYYECTNVHTKSTDTDAPVKHDRLSVVYRFGHLLARACNYISILDPRPRKVIKGLSSPKSDSFNIITLTRE